MSEKFDRLLTILNLLDRGTPCPPKDLAEKLEVSERTVFRYLSSLQNAGIPIYFDRERGSYSFADGFSLKKALLTPNELLALKLARELVTTLGKGFERSLDALEQKLLSIAQCAAGKSKAVPLAISPQERPASGEFFPWLHDLVQATEDFRLVELSYESLHEVEITVRAIEPCYLFFADGVWLVRAWCRLREDWRTFALDRIRSLQMTDQHFLPRRSINMERELSEGFGPYVEDGEPVEVVLRMHEDIAPYVLRRKWHPSQTHHELPDGGVEIRFLVRGIQGIKPWIYRWIPYVTVISPDYLKQKIEEDLKRQMHLLTSS